MPIQPFATHARPGHGVDVSLHPDPLQKASRFSFISPHIACNQRPVLTGGSLEDENWFWHIALGLGKGFLLEELHSLHHTHRQKHDATQ